MKKVWVYKRKNIKGWWVGWYESSNRKAKALPSKELAEHFKHLKYTQLNSDVFTGQVIADWNQMISEYREAKKVQGVTEGTLYEIALSLRNFERLDRYLNGNIRLKELKEEERPVRSLSATQITKLSEASGKYPAIKIRILLALGTGLRRGDIDSLKISDIDFERNCIATSSRKTKKSMASRPVSPEVMAELSKYVCRLDVGQEKLFRTKFNHRKWRKICKMAGLSGLKFHDLRRTFCSLLAQNGVSTAVTQRLLEHSSPDLTNRVYTNVDPVLRQSVERLPIHKWL